jgi:hypothetical protein
MSQPPVHDPLPIVVETQDGVKRRLLHVELCKLIARLGAEGDHFAIAQRIPADDRFYMQTWREGTEPYLVEFRDGGEDRHFYTRIADPGQVAEVFADWAREGVAWRRQPEWERADLSGGPELSAELRESAEEFAGGLINGGFRTYEQVTCDVADFLLAAAERADPDDESTASELAEGVVEGLWERRLAEQAEWPETTDPDRLLAAFDALESQGVVARPDFACCRQCGESEIAGEAAAGSPAAQGYVFFHQQDTARAAEGEGLYLAYGPLPGSPVDTGAVGRRIADALTEAGLPYRWDGSPDQRILVTPLEWRKRLPQRLP